mgnify:FL=1
MIWIIFNGIHLPDGTVIEDELHPSTFSLTLTLSQREREFQEGGWNPSEGDEEINPKSSHTPMGGRGSRRAASFRKTHGLKSGSPGGSPSLAYTGHDPKGKGETGPFFCHLSRVRTCRMNVSILLPDFFGILPPEIPMDIFIPFRLLYG